MNDHMSSDLASWRIERNDPPPSSRRALRWFVLLVVAVAIGLVGWFYGVPVVGAQLFKTQVGVTEIALVSPAQAQIRLTSTGYVVPQVQVDVASKLVGRIEKATVREGSTVRQGQVLFELDPSDLRAQVASAQA